MPFFSIIIPLFNKENYIQDTLNSAISQEFSDFEIIVINDGSTDRSLDIVALIEDSRIRIIHQENQGVASARNYGISEAKGKYMALLDADDVWKPNHLSQLKKSIETFPNASLYCNNYEVQLTRSVVKPARFNLNLKDSSFRVEDFFEASTINCLAWTSAVSFTKEVHEKLNGFEDTYETCEDLDFWIKAALDGDVIFNPEITMTYKKFVENSLMKNDNNQLRYNFINSYKKEERNIKSLKRFLDINRYALAIRCILSNELNLYKKVRFEIDPMNLNRKQLLLLKSPKFVIRSMKKFQSFLTRKGMYLSAFK